MNKPNIYKRFRFPSVIIQYAVWLYYRFNLSHRDIADLLAERGINVTYEAIRGYLHSVTKKLVDRLRFERLVLYTDIVRQVKNLFSSTSM